MTKNLNKIIDVNYYPVEEARRSNFRHRPIGLGVQVDIRLPFNKFCCLALFCCRAFGFTLENANIFRVWPMHSC